MYPGITKFDDFYKDDTIMDWICPKCIQSALPFNHFDDDDDFIVSLSEYWPVFIDLSLQTLRQKIFMPFESNNDSKTHPLYDNDPDYHYFNLYFENLYACDYYAEDTFNVKFNELSFPEKCLFFYDTS